MQYLGRGTSGKVFLCMDVLDRRLYAVKIVRKTPLEETTWTPDSGTDGGSYSEAGTPQYIGSRSRSQPETPGTAYGTRSPSTPSSPTGEGGEGKDFRGRPLRPRGRRRRRQFDPIDDLRREIAIMRSGGCHRNVVALREVVDDPNSNKMLIVMEYCEGGPVMTRAGLDRGRKIPEEVARPYFRDMLTGLSYLHSQRVIHGDLKPENALMGATGRVLLSDFGCSKILPNGEEILDRCNGTPAFLAPEMMRSGAKYRGRAADVYALGACLFTFLFGRIPFWAESIAELFEVVKTQELTFPESPKISDQVKSFLRRLLDKNPDNRISIAEAAIDPWTTDNGRLPPAFPVVKSGVPPNTEPNTPSHNDDIGPKSPTALGKINQGNKDFNNEDPITAPVRSYEVLGSTCVDGDEALNALVQQEGLEVAKFTAGQWLVRQGDRSNHVLYILRGHVEVLYCPADIMEQESESPMSPMSPTSDHGAANITNNINNNNNNNFSENNQKNTTPTPDQIPPQQVTASGVEVDAKVQAQQRRPPMVPALQLQQGNLDKSALEQESQAEQSREEGIPSFNLSSNTAVAPDSYIVQPFGENIAYQDNRTSSGSANDVIANNNNVDESSVPRVSPFGDYNLTSSSSAQVNSTNTAASAAPSDAVFGVPSLSPPVPALIGLPPRGQSTSPSRIQNKSPPRRLFSGGVDQPGYISPRRLGTGNWAAIAASPEPSPRLMEQPHGSLSSSFHLSMGATSPSNVGGYTWGGSGISAISAVTTPQSTPGMTPLPSARDGEHSTTMMSPPQRDGLSPNGVALQQQQQQQQVGRGAGGGDMTNNPTRTVAIESGGIANMTTTTTTTTAVGSTPGLPPLPSSRVYSSPLKQSQHGTASSTTPAAGAPLHQQQQTVTNEMRRASSGGLSSWAPNPHQAQLPRAFSAGSDASGVSATEIDANQTPITKSVDGLTTPQHHNHQQQQQQQQRIMDIPAVLAEAAEEAVGFTATLRRENREYLLALRGHGDFLGETALIGGSSLRRSASLRAKGDVQAVLIPYETAKEHFKVHPLAKQRLAELVWARQNETIVLECLLRLGNISVELRERVRK